MCTCKRLQLILSARTGYSLTHTHTHTLSSHTHTHTCTGENLTAPNLYAVLTIISFFMLIPISLAMEAPALVKTTIDAAIAGVYGSVCCYCCCLHVCVHACMHCMVERFVSV